jgi:site-specific DNA recombinase
MRKFVHGRGWRVYGEFVDARYPGAMDQQPALDELMHEASKHRFDCIVVTKLDRFTFSYTGLIGRLQRLDELAIRFVAVLHRSIRPKSSMAVTAPRSGLEMSC